MKSILNIIGYIDFLGHQFRSTNYIFGNSTNSRNITELKRNKTYFRPKLDVDFNRENEPSKYPSQYSHSVTWLGWIFNDRYHASLYLNNFGDNPNDMSDLEDYIRNMYCIDCPSGKVGNLSDDRYDTIVISSVSRHFSPSDFDFKRFLAALKMNTKITQFECPAAFNLDEDRKLQVLRILERNRAYKKMLPWYLRPDSTISMAKTGIGAVLSHIAGYSPAAILGSLFGAALVESIIKTKRREQTVSTAPIENQSAFKAGEDAAKSWYPGWTSCFTNFKKLAHTTICYPDYLKGMASSYVEEEKSKRVLSC